MDANGGGVEVQLLFSETGFQWREEMMTKSELLLHASRLEDAARDLRRMADAIEDEPSAPGVICAGQFSDAMVRDIRERAGRGQSATNIAIHYGVSRGLIWSVVKGLSYRDVSP